MAELAADFAVGADPLETEGQVQADRRVVGQGDAAKGAVDVLARQRIEQGRVEAPAEPLAAFAPAPDRRWFRSLVS